MMWRLVTVVVFLRSIGAQTQTAYMRRDSDGEKKLEIDQHGKALGEVREHRPAELQAAHSGSFIEFEHNASFPIAPDGTDLHTGVNPSSIGHATPAPDYLPCAVLGCDESADNCTYASGATITKLANKKVCAADEMVKLGDNQGDQGMIVDLLGCIAAVQLKVKEEVPTCQDTFTQDMVTKECKCLAPGETCTQTDETPTWVHCDASGCPMLLNKNAQVDAVAHPGCIAASEAACKSNGRDQATTCMWWMIYK